MTKINEIYRLCILYDMQNVNIKKKVMFESSLYISGSVLYCAFVLFCIINVILYILVVSLEI